MEGESYRKEGESCVKEWRRISSLTSDKLGHLVAGSLLMTRVLSFPIISDSAVMNAGTCVAATIYIAYSFQFCNDVGRSIRLLLTLLCNPRRTDDERRADDDRMIFRALDYLLGASFMIIPTFGVTYLASQSAPIILGAIPFLDSNTVSNICMVLKAVLSIFSIFFEHSSLVNMATIGALAGKDLRPLDGTDTRFVEYNASQNLKTQYNKCGDEYFSSMVALVAPVAVALLAYLAACAMQSAGCCEM